MENSLSALSQSKKTDLIHYPSSGKPRRVRITLTLSSADTVAVCRMLLKKGRKGFLNSIERVA